jgi:hypothetical protein
MPESPENQSPLKGEWSSEGILPSKMHINPDYPGKLVRHESLERYSHDPRGFQHKEGEEPDIERSVKLFKVLKEQVEAARNCGVRLPSLEVVFGKNSINGRKDALLIMDKVDGIHPMEIEEPPHKLIQELIDYYIAVADYYKTYIESPSILTDFGSHQLMWGNIEGDDETHLYHIDIEPNLTNQINITKQGISSDSQTKKTNQLHARLELRRILMSMEDIEKKWGVGILERAKKLVLEDYRQIADGKDLVDLSHNFSDIWSNGFPEDLE